MVQVGPLCTSFETWLTMAIQHFNFDALVYFYLLQYLKNY